jgi:tetratricopeptide (TPR) repeat protein
MDDIDHAISLQQARRFAEARAVCERMLTADPRRADAINLLGVMAHQEGRPAEAIASFRRAVDVAPDYLPARTLVFNGNFNGNMRVLQDLTSNLVFNGNVSRLSFGGRIGSFEPGNTIVPVNVAINVTGRLNYLNSNSYFQAITPGQSGIFWNDATSNDPNSLAATGALTTGRYLTVVPTRQTVTPPAPLPPQQYSVPGVPTDYSAALNGSSDGINVSFAAPTSSGSLPGDGNLPVLYYEFTTDATAGTPTWTRWLNAAQGPGTDIALPGPSTGGPFVPGSTYNVSVRAVNALGAGTGTSQTEITIPNV